MNIKIIELLVEILDAVRNNISLEDFNKKIAKENKFDKQTISAAFSMIYEKSFMNNKYGNEETKSFRILTNEENLFLGKENSNYLLHLQNIGLLSNDDLEMIIEQLAMYPSDKISRGEINMMILFSLVEKSSNILPGSRVTLFPSDTIN